MDELSAEDFKVFITELFQTKPDLEGELQNFAEELLRYNQKYNLTGFKDQPSVVWHLLYESLLVEKLRPLPSASHWLDLGSGAGVPGAVLALAYPESSFDSLDKSPVKIAFQKHWAALTERSNFFPINQELQNFLADKPEPAYDGVVSRAFKPLPRVLELLPNLLKKGGFAYLWQGPDWQKLWTELEPRYPTLALKKVLAYQVPAVGSLAARRSFLLLFQQLDA